MSLPGQTIGVSAFTDPLMEAVHLTRSQLSLAYLIGTLASSLLLTPAGKLYDRYGARVMAITSAAILGSVLIFLSYTGRITDHLSLSTTQAMAMTAFGFFVLRFSGQGVLTMTCRNMAMKWFDQFRGLVNGMQGPLVALGFSMAPAWFGGMIGHWGWESSWRGMGFFALFVFTIFAWIFFRDNPEDCGLIPDGKPIRLNKHSKSFPLTHEMELKEARDTISFWAIAMTLGYSSLFVTALSYHHRAIFASAGLEVDSTIKFFFPLAAVISVILKVVGGILSDKVSVRTLLYIFATGHIFSAAGFFLLSTPVGLWLLIIGHGIGGGFFTVLAGVCYPRLFGRKHLGAISGLSMAIIVFSSAIGPYLFSLINDFTSSFTSAFYILTVLIAVLLVMAAKTVNPQIKEVH
jgi:OFA family oxalate/formate antiporter-like MFS transporter